MHIFPRKVLTSYQQGFLFLYAKEGLLFFLQDEYIKHGGIGEGAESLKLSEEKI